MAGDCPTAGAGKRFSDRVYYVIGAAEYLREQEIIIVWKHSIEKRKNDEHSVGVQYEQ